MVQSLDDLMAQKAREAEEISVLQAETHQYNDVEMYNGPVYQIDEEQNCIVMEPSEKCGKQRYHKCCYRHYSPRQGRETVIWAQLEFSEHSAKRHRGHITEFQDRKYYLGMGNGRSNLRFETKL